MKKVLLILILLSFVNCKKKTAYFNLSILNQDYNLNLQTGEYKMEWYNNYSDKIKLTQNEKEKINELIFKYHLDTLKGIKLVEDNKNSIMPYFNDVFILKEEKDTVSRIDISRQANLNSKFTKTEIDILNFRKDIFELLEENSDFRRNLDTLEVAKKKVQRLFL
ncbi:hypothetical protein ACSVH2_00100 [Flavobacterium sp. RSB2_4_14]|uniref:hypothetical protein n=1 Tax=Flavobacterium sp. RSB2_4_14 TaxID=3447665 RepID=UPI003F3B6761